MWIPTHVNGYTISCNGLMLIPFTECIAQSMQNIGDEIKLTTYNIVKHCILKTTNEIQNIRLGSLKVKGGRKRERERKGKPSILYFESKYIN